MLSYGNISIHPHAFANLSSPIPNYSFAFVEFEERRDAEDAFDKFDGFSVDGRRLKLDWDVGINKKEDRRTPRQGGEREPWVFVQWLNQSIGCKSF